MTEGISKERLIGLMENPNCDSLDYAIYDYLLSLCTELDPWIPIDENTPKGKRGFLAIDKDRESIEWLSDIGEDKFYNNNSNNFTDKFHWTHYKLLPYDPL